MPDDLPSSPSPADVDRRTEHDMLGARALPHDALFGIQADRAVENFRRPRALVVGEIAEFACAFGMVKLAALRANVECGAVSGPVAGALGTACIELAQGDPRMRAALVVPLLQGGAGTSTNMNVNEVLANRALELLGYPPGSYEHCHPNDHVNRSQSTNDTYPTALRLALVARIGTLAEVVDRLSTALRAKGREHAGVAKLGRTQLQDAVPMTVDQEFDAWADALDAANAGLVACVEPLLEVNLGGTAIGTGLATPPGYDRLVIEHLVQISGLEVRPADRPVSATTAVAGLMRVSAAQRELAVAAAKVANDLRLLASGPRTGLAELRLPPVQNGSSMMPGKVNPVIPEFVNQVAFAVRGGDQTVVAALDAAQLQLQAMLPVVAATLFTAQDDLVSALDALRERCVDGIEVDVARVQELAELGLGELSVLAATHGYAAATQLALSDGRSSDPRSGSAPAARRSARASRRTR